MDYYALLGLQQTATTDDIKSAYRRQAKSDHPDIGGDPEKFKQLNEAHDILKDPDKRAHYDHARNGAGRIHVNINGRNHDIFSDIFTDMSSTFGDQSGPFAKPRNYRKQTKNKDLNINIVCDLKDTLMQQEKSVSIRHISGDRKIVQITVPRGVKNNDRIRYTGLGDASFQELTPGDLYVTITVSNETNFQIDGNHLYCTHTLNCFDAITGTVVSIKSLDNTTLNVTINSGTQNGTMFSLKKQGLYEHGSPNRGNIVLVVAIKIPENLKQDQLNIIKDWQKEINY
jgi:curved DNA-binding protein|tara:strand:- start:669 stop:1523 length:855 start_codon:yes stop_codon:yes gene_type:complete